MSVGGVVCTSDASPDAYPGGHSGRRADGNASPNVYARSNRDSNSGDCDCGSASDFHSASDINANSNCDATTYIDSCPDASICCRISNTGAYHFGDRYS